MKQQLRKAWLLIATATLLVVGLGLAAADAAGASKKKGIEAKISHGTLRVEGTKAGEEIALRLRAGDANVLEVVSPSGVMSFSRNAFTRIEVEADDGDDLLRIDEANGAFTNTEETTLAGEDDNDDLRGGSGAETFRGGSGDDEADGNQGADSALMGSGDDSFTWDPGDGSDRVEGRFGDDTLIFNGSAGAENFEASADGQRLRFTRNLGNIVMDVDGTERVELRALGGADNTTMNDLRRTDVDELDIDLASALGGSAGDGEADTITLLGSDSRGRDDDVRIQGTDGNISVTGLSALVRIAHAEPALDQLSVKTLAGDDAVDAAGLAASSVKLSLDGGSDDDRLLGSAGIDSILGGEDDDEADGNQGNDVASLGTGDDSFTWDPGDGSDVVEGQEGSDRMIFNGSGGSEIFEFLANGPRLTFTRNLGSIVMDLDDVERVDLEALGGADLATVNDLTGTDVARANIDLEGVLGSRAGDGQPDQIVVNGTAGPDSVSIAGGSSGIEIDGLAPEIRIDRSEAANDKLAVNTLAGIDSVNASGLDDGAIQLTLDGGADGDSLSGSQGGDKLVGGAGVDQLAGNDGDDAADGDQGNDTASLGDGDDDFTWDPGDGSDIVEGQDGDDRMIFNGSNGDEIFTVNAVGPRVEFLRNLGNIDMDLDDVERIDLDALGGTDSTTVNDLSGTDLEDVNVDLEGVIGGGAADGAADTVTVNATNGVDTIDVAAAGGEVVVTGLAATVRVAHADPLLDQLVLNTLAGADQVTIGAGVDALLGLTVNQ
jgi:Ca2+-binding RTX toxin-like protein